jgi:hypothetical protein
MMGQPPEIKPETKVRRYLSLWAAVNVLRTRKLRLTLVEHLREKFDPFEGTIPRPEQQHLDILLMHRGMAHQQVEQWAAHYTPDVRELVRRNPVPDGWAEMQRLRSAKRRSAHASCWMAGDESDAMWRLYCDDGDRGLGVSLQTTWGALKASVEPHHLICRGMIYRSNVEHDGHRFTDDHDLYFWKRKGFEHEGEARLVHYDAAHYQALTFGPAPAPAELHRYIFRDWDAVATLESVIISPYADGAYERTARDVLSWAAASAAFADKVELSALHPRRYTPNP